MLTPKEHKTRLIKRLRKYGGDNGAKLAHILAKCRPKSRCGSGACPECQSAMQEWFTREMKRIVKRPQIIWALSIIPTQSTKEGTRS